MESNLFANIPADLPDELFQTLLSSDNIRIERILSKGHHSAPDSWYDQDQNEWVLLIQGEAKVTFLDRILHLRSGDYVNIPAHEKHRVAWTTPDIETIWLAIFY